MDWACKEAKGKKQGARIKKQEQRIESKAGLFFKKIIFG
jgi:hypothetical protein